MSTGKKLEDLQEKNAVAEKAKPQLHNPPLYKVTILNDDYTPMDFVVEVLKRFFLMSDPLAITIMLKVHYQGKGACGVFTRDIAETKVMLVNEYARAHDHPLLCQMEKN